METMMIIIWFSVFILAALIEMNTMDLTSIWFSVGALLAFVLSIASAHIWLQVTVFVVTSLLLILSDSLTIINVKSLICLNGIKLASIKLIFLQHSCMILQK